VSPAAPRSMTRALGLDRPRLEDVVTRAGLGELLGSLEHLGGVGCSVIDPTEGAALRGGTRPEQAPLVERAAEELRARGDASRLVGPREVEYRATPIHHEGVVVAHLLVGPYVAIESETAASDRALRFSAPPPTDAEVGRLPHLAPPRVTEIATHAHRAVERLIRSGYEARITAEMHAASIEQSYHEALASKARLEDAYERLQVTDRLKSAFLGTMSHELRTPLTAILGYAEMLADGIGGTLSTTQLEFVETIRTRGDQLLRLILDLLDLSKLESGTILVRRGSVPIRNVLAESIATLEPAARKRGVNIELTGTSDVPEVDGDPDRLRQVFVNLLDNAVKFSPEGAVIRVSAQVEQIADDSLDGVGASLLAPMAKLVVVRVADAGVGIPEEQRSRVFDAFYQVDQSTTREHGGAGLGLAIVKRIVEAHDGRIGVEGNEPRGAVFVVGLPSARPRLADDGARPE
jgi:two-component system sensor histidine kinase BarA